MQQLPPFYCLGLSLNLFKGAFYKPFMLDVGVILLKNPGSSAPTLEPCFDD